MEIQNSLIINQSNPKLLGGRSLEILDWFSEKDGELEFHTYGGDTRPEAFISQIKRADKSVGLDDFNYIRLYTTDNNPGYAMVESSPEPVFSQCQIDESSYCCKSFKMKQFHPNLIICPDFQFFLG